MENDKQLKTVEDLERDLVELYTSLKVSWLLAEETTPDFLDFLQPPFEINRAYDHINRAKSVHLGIAPPSDGQNPDQYIRDNLDKAKGHLYRAYFDIVDWLSINLRESISDFFGQFSAGSIRVVTPEYFTEIVPVVEEVSAEIAKIRANKDVANSGTLELLKKYESQIEKLRSLLNEARRKAPGLMQFEKQQRKEGQRAIVRQVLMGLLMALVGASITYLLT
jgi:hypothetical protein